ncbi:winged helix-turn-helix domain-containing protein [Streptomyces bluensis]|uniref:winged helix-turn-helix domain-containing protein n=1 Tax=Streptomyces bluensis TaxID=33897 RepID=UPI0036A6ABEA
MTRRTQRAGTGQTGPAGQTAQAGPAGQFAGADAYGPGTSGASSSRGAESWSRAGDSFGGDSFQGDSFGGESLRSDAYGGEPLRSESYGGDAYGGDSYGDESYGGESYGGESFSSYEPADTTRQFASSRSFEKGPEPRASRTARHARDANSSFGSTASYDRTRSFESPDPVFDPAPPPPEAAPEGPSGPLVVDRRTRQVWVGNAPVALTPKEFELLALLTEDPGAVYSRQQILDRVWDPHYEGPTKTLDVHVATLRRKLGNSAWIQTLRGVGFRLAVHTRPPAAYQAQAPGPQAAYR